MEEEILKDQELEDVLQAVTHKLVAHLFCSDNKCTNYQRSCYVTAKGTIHQAVGSRAVCLWSRAIMKKEVSLETSPVNVVLRPLDQIRRGKGNNNSDAHSVVFFSAPPIHIYNQPAPTPSTPLAIVSAIPIQNGDNNQSDLAIIL